MALGMALLRTALGDERLGSAIGWNALNVALCSAAGPTIGALILAVASARWIFVAGLPIAAAALLASRALPEMARENRPIAGTSIALHGGSVALLVVGVELAASRPAAGVALASAALPCFALLVVRERGRRAPLLPLDLLALPSFRLSVAASICCFTGQSLGLVVLPFYLQTGLGRGPLAAGMIVTCWPMAVAATSVLAGRMGGRFGTAAQCAAGGALLAAGLLLSALAPAGKTLMPLVVGTVLSGAGFGLFQLANNRNLYLAAPAERSGAAGAMQGTARLTGQTTGTLMTSLSFTLASAAAAPRIALAAGAAFALAAAAISATHPRAPARLKAARTAPGCSPPAARAASSGRRRSPRTGRS
jgi:DHA2 family multidrug resistance protein-like MFS transporter